MKEYTIDDYIIFKIPKRKGGFRQIEAPKDHLKNEQLKYKDILYNVLKVSKYAHGFVPGRSIVTNAIPHVNKKYILKIDIKDFFSSIEYCNFIAHLQYTDTYQLFHIRDKIKMHYNDKFKDESDFLNKLRLFFIKINHISRLPQGGPLSPWISNSYMYYFDNVIAKIIYNYTKGLYDNKKIIPRIDYTRYADDIIISGDYKKGVWFIFNKIKKLLCDKMYLKINDKKIKFIPWYRRQTVTGIVVNKKINLPKEYRKRIRAMKHQLKLGKISLDKYKQGMLSFEHMVYLQKDIDIKSISKTFEFELLEKILT